jgi:hypothetical protein
VQTAADSADDALDVSAAIIVQPHESITLIERMLRAGRYRHTPGAWDIIERRSYGLIDRALRLPEDTFALLYRLRPLDELARQHAREAHARARQRAREQGH